MQNSAPHPKQLPTVLQRKATFTACTSQVFLLSTFDELGIMAIGL
ncbi:MAG: hypothetical protein K0Q50_3106 [Vampirovibrio sp.]|nr:hypothetical protein [Vampirovibrio sp.]